MENYLEINKKLWNDKTDFHYNSEFYDVESFVKGRDSLNSIELELLGDIAGKKILHLQCHFGQDTISLARHGAEVTGVDLSDQSIKRANELNKQCGTNVRFIQSDVNSLKEVLDEQFDIVFTSYGTVGWHPDVMKWAETIENFVKPGGEFLIVDFHPVVWIFSDDFKKIEYNYSDSNPIIEEYTGTYTDRDADIKCKSYCWNHGLAHIVNSLIKQGLNIKDFQEYFYSPYNCFQNTIEVEKGKFQIKGLENKIPMLYSIVAEKPQ
jgi:ubiquinone/menaquinone biosynthesis C-methylase UbiE